MKAEEFSKLLKKSNGRAGCCPAHDDSTESLSFKDEGDRLLVHCHAGCSAEQIMAALGLKMSDLFNGDGRPKRGGVRVRAGGFPSVEKILTVAQLAAAKQIPEEFLRKVGVQDSPKGVTIEYRLPDGSLAPRQRLRIGLTEGRRFVWTGKEGVGVEPYLLGLDDARAEGFTFVVEGESDAWTLRFLSYHAIGIPGADMAQKLRGEHVDKVPLLYVLQEQDKPKPGKVPGGVTFVEGLRERLGEIGWAGNAVVIRMPDSLKDINDLWLACQASAEEDRWVQFITKLDRAIKDGVPLAAWARPADAPGLVGARPGRPAFVVKHLDPADPEHDLSVLTSAAWSLIKGINAPPCPWLLKTRAIARIERDEEDRPFFRELTPALLRYELAEHVEFLAEKKDGNVPVPPPPILISNLLATPAPPIPRCRRIVTTPVFAADCRLVDQPGYDPDALLFYEPPAGFSLPPIPERPTARDIAAAVALLVEPFDEFPYKDREVALAHTLGALLTLFVRDLIKGPTPLFLFKKPVPGVGSTLMVSALGLIMTGTEPPMTAPVAEDAEWRKKITSLLIKGPQVVVLDNLRKIDSTALSTVLTSWPTWNDRLLGTNDDSNPHVRCVWLGTGNQVQLTTEQHRRTVRIELAALSERPWLSGIEYRHKALLDWVKAERERLVAAALTLVRAWIVAGRPRGSVSLGTYEAWSAVVGGILSVAGVPGFLGNLTDEDDAVDDETELIKPFLAAYWANTKFVDHVALAGELFDMVQADPSIAPRLRGETDHERRSAFGLLLSTKYKDRVFDLADGLTVRLVRPKGTRHDKKSRWQLVRVEAREGFSQRTGTHPHPPAPHRDGVPGDDEVPF